MYVYLYQCGLPPQVGVFASILADHQKAKPEDNSTGLAPNHTV